MPSVRLLLVVASLGLGTGVLHAGPLSAGIASAVPVDVTEVVAGGTWVDGAASGSFRTVTVLAAGDPESAEVYIQWVGSRSPVDALQIISSVGLREFNEQKAAWASVALETDAEGSATITVSGQDTQSRPVGPLTFVATLPGVYRVALPVAGPQVKN
jgi:hypothetical protein